jgi:hypothetical protein
MEVRIIILKLGLYRQAAMAVNDHMSPLERLVQRATRLPLETVQLIIAEARRSMAQLRLRQSEAARTIQTASLRPNILRSRAAVGRPGANQFVDWFMYLPRRYQDRYFAGREYE